LHRVATVRQQQGVSLRSAARQLGTDVRNLRQQEGETTDLRLSQLLEWQRVLEVPIVDLLIEPGTPLSRPVLERARLVRLMKTVMAIRQQAPSTRVQRLTQTMVDQLVEIMPELAQVGPWHSVGQRRSLEEYGVAAQRSLSDDFFHRPRNDG
jgi:transcriptional regulator with XRE-family HTH domain